MKNYAMLALVSFLALSACEPTTTGAGTGEPVQDGNYTWIKRSSRGFEVVVPNDFSPQLMRSEFGNYCNRYNSVTRSLKMERDSQGRKTVVGECL